MEANNIALIFANLFIIKKIKSGNHKNQSNPGKDNYQKLYIPPYFFFA
ncbi:hypothetical protein CLV51_1011552 [Chitinophaga niastensis]|uniref:Uncharacterized protein n=1 Tax=Chitinophaga niastensis TaxID=536980 RepID=A0A2P8HVJ8_CHINA|nr:hypothetical protein CLV51_1011552 [Chitinophaga niastensis]